MSHAPTFHEVASCQNVRDFFDWFVQNGRSNYRSCSIALYGTPDTLLGKPELLEAVTPACRSAGWFWQSNRLNELADAWPD